MADVTPIHPNGSAVTRIHPQDETTSGGGGGTVINYTTYNSPWTAEEPWRANYFGDGFEIARNANNFAPTPPCSSTAF